MGAKEDAEAAVMHLAYVRSQTNDPQQIKAAEDNMTRASARAMAETAAQGAPAAPSSNAPKPASAPFTW